MEVVTGALPSVITKLGDLLVGEYNLQKGVKGEIRFLQSELESMKGALEKISDTPADQLDIQDRIWARNLRGLSYDIEDSIDRFMVHGIRDESANLHGLRKFIDRSTRLFRKAKTRHGIATEIRDIKSRVTEVHQRRLRYSVNNGVDKPAATTKVDPRLFTQYTEAKELVRIDETRDELIKVLMDGNGVPLQQGKIVSIVGFGGLGKTTLAKAVYEKIRGIFECCAFVSVSQTPDLKKLLKGLLYDLGEKIIEQTLDERRLIDAAREFLKQKRYLIVIDDIWDISVWKQIKCALPCNDVGYIVITTTRHIDVAEEVGGAYKLEALCMNNSRKLLYRRVFGNENNDNTEDREKCPDEELAEVSDRILKKCAGVPLAIITMASLLAYKARNKMDWYDVYHSIGTGLEDNLDVENMRMILSFSYYNMPSHLRTCLLYLSMFPEDYIIEKDRLIWMWIAEGFIQCERQGMNLFEQGENYFNALINRSMIQPKYDGDESMVYGCHVHDMVLDLIRALSSEANFTTILSSMDQMSPSSMIRRLSIQNGKEDNIMAPAATSFQQVRSLVVHRSATSLIPVLRSFLVLRVMDLEYCDLSKDYSLKYIGNLLHLRYLGLRSTSIVQLPQEIGNLQFLQTMDIRYNKSASLPLSVVQLKHLVCLNMDMSTIVTNGIGSLSSLEVLSCIHVNDSNMDIILEELAQLTELKVLYIFFVSERGQGKQVEFLFLHKLQKIQDLTIGAITSSPNKIGVLDAWVAPRCLRKLNIKGCWFSTLPVWINPSHVPNLSKLWICVRKIQQADLDILGKLQALRLLSLQVHHDKFEILGGFIFEPFVVGAGSFPCLIVCQFWEFASPIVFRQGAMPRLRTLRSQFSVYACRGGVRLDFGLGFLPSLEKIVFWLDCEGASKDEVKGLKDMLCHATAIHPNQPSLAIR